MLRTTFLRIAIIFCFLTTTSQAAVIAHYRFEPGNFTVDSSPGGLNPLTNGAGAAAATSVTDVMDVSGGSGSAYFDGGDIMSTTASLDLTSYRHLRISWHQRKHTNSFARVIFEHSTNYNSNVGSIISISNSDFSPASTTEGYIALKTAAFRTSDEFPQLAGTSPPGTWQKFVAEINLDAATIPDIIKIYDGSNNLIGTTTDAFAAPASFINQIMYIGNRSAAALGFTGNIDELMFESIPEPSGLALLGAGFFFLGRRKC